MPPFLSDNNRRRIGALPSTTGQQREPILASEAAVPRLDWLPAHSSYRSRKLPTHLTTPAAAESMVFRGSKLTYHVRQLSAYGQIHSVGPVADARRRSQPFSVAWRRLSLAGRMATRSVDRRILKSMGRRRLPRSSNWTKATLKRQGVSLSWK